MRGENGGSPNKSVGKRSCELSLAPAQTHTLAPSLRCPARSRVFGGARDGSSGSGTRMPTWVLRSPLGSARLGSSPAALGSLRSCLLASASSRCALKASARRRGHTEHVRAGRRVLRRDRRAWMAPRGRYRGGEGGSTNRGGGGSESYM